MFWLQRFFLDTGFKLLDRDYKTKHTSRHVAKFRGDRPTEVGDLVAKKIIKTVAQHKAFPNYRSGWHN